VKCYQLDNKEGRDGTKSRPRRGPASSARRRGRAPCAGQVEWARTRLRQMHPCAMLPRRSSPLRVHAGAATARPRECRRGSRRCR
jgi:hypothetical protein